MEITWVIVIVVVLSVMIAFWARPKKPKPFPEQYPTVEDIEFDRPQSEESKAEELRQLKENEATALKYLQDKEMQLLR